MKRVSNNREGQNAIEYLLVFAVVMVVLLSFLSPKEGGFFRGKLDNALDLSMKGVECIAASVCYEEGGCDPCGDGCCQEGEEVSCYQDCVPCIRDPSLGPCNVDDCSAEKGCESKQKEICTGSWPHQVCAPIPGVYECVEIPCTAGCGFPCVSR